MKKMGLALSLTAAFGLMACGDSSSNANGGMPTCNVTSDANSVTMTSSFQGESYIQKVVIDGDFTIKTTTMKGMPQEDVDEECYITKMDNRGAEVTCSGNTITVKDDAGFSRTDLTKYLESKKIQTRNLFAGNLLRHPAMEAYTAGKDYRVVGELKKTEAIMNQTFWIGVYPGMTRGKLDFMAQTIREFCTKK